MDVLVCVRSISCDNWRDPSLERGDPRRIGRGQLDESAIDGGDARDAVVSR